MKDNREKEPEIKVKSVKKALDVLNCFIKKQPLGVTEISEMLGLYKSNVYDILTTLTAMEYLTQVKETGKYELGIGAARLGNAVGDRFGFHKLAGRHIHEIAAEVGETVYLTTLMGTSVLYLDVAVPSNERSPAIVSSVRNNMEPLHCTSCGKAMLACMPDSFVKEYLSMPMEKFTEYTITDPVELSKEIAKIRERGYSRDQMEYSVCISCVAVPIVVHGNLQGVISISAPSPRMEDARVMQFVEILRQHVRQIESDLSK